MKLTHKDSSAKFPKTAFLVVFATEGKKAALPKGVKLPAAATEDFKGELYQSRLTDASGGDARRVLSVGLGKAKEVTAEVLRRAAAVGSKKAESNKAGDVVLWVADEIAKLAGGPEQVGRAVAEGAVMATYKYSLGKSKPEPASLKRATTIAAGAPFRRGVKLGTVLANANIETRKLQDQAGNQVTPRVFAAEARKLAKSPRITTKVLDEAAMKKLGMGLLLGVSQGSKEPARLVHLTYKPKGKARGKIALVGKGLTFDAGGISLKPAAGMEEMRYDMSGGAAVMGVFHALQKIDVPYEVHGLVPSSENLPGAAATKPGDVHTCMNGTTVEIVNTDAEGRLILADALAYTVKTIKPDTIIDLATLTGAVVVGLGHEVSGMYTTTDRLRDDLRAAGEKSGEIVWPMPLLEHFKKNLASGPADLCNISGRQLSGGSIGAAMFLSHFVGDTEWCHLDIAGAAWNQEPRDYVGGKGGTGVGTRLLMDYLLR